MRFARVAPAAFGVVLLLVSSAPAQTRATTADLALRVADPSGGVLPGVTVVVTSADTNLSRSDVTTAEGRLLVPALPLGPYTVRITLDGFRPEQREVVVRLGTVTELDATLQLASLQARVDVVAAAPLEDVDRSVVAAVVGERQIADLPIDRRDYISFAKLVPGVSSDRTPNQGPALSSGLTFAGQSARANNITVDGLDNNEDAVGGVRAVFSQDAVREFQVLVNSYSAEFGQAAGGVVNIVTKSGTNQVAGGAFGFFRDRALNARGHFDDFDAAGRRIDAPKAPFNQQQFGTTLGGPIRRDRTFAFGAVERLSIRDSSTVTIDDQTTVMHPFAPIALGTPAQILRNGGFPVDVGAVPFSVRTTTVFGKIDHAFSGHSGLSLRFNAADGFNGNSQPYGGLVARSRGALQTNHDYMFAGSLSTVRRHTVVNELRGEIARRHVDLESLDPSCGGPCVREDQGGPALEVAGVASLGRHAFTPQPRTTLWYEVLDTLGFDLGRHHVKVGVDLKVVDNRRSTLPLQFGGQFIFVSIPASLAAAIGLPGAVSSIQAVALGLPVAYVQGYGQSAVSQVFRNVSAFAQDDWQATPRLTVRYGVRYQKTIWPGEAYTANGYPGDYHVTGGHYFAPRLGVAWDPSGSGRTSVNAAYGLFYASPFNVPIGSTKVIDGVHLRTVVVPAPLSIVAWQSPGHRLPTAALDGFPSVSLAVAPSFASPYTHQASAGVNHELRGGLSLSISGVVVRGHRFVGLLDFNPTDPSLGRGRRPLDTNGVAGTSATLGQYNSWGESWYRGLLVSVTKRLSDRSQVLVSYTLSKAEDSISDYFASPPQDQGHGRNPADPSGLPLGFDPAKERGPSLQDQRHRLVVSGLYDLPGRFEVSGIFTAGSGRPYNAVVGVDLNGDGDANVTPGPDRPRRDPADPSTSIGRNSRHLPKETRLDLRLLKRFALTGRTSVTLIVDVLNALNATNYTDVNRVFGTGAYPANPLPTFGQFTQAAPPRQIQIGARMAF